MIHRPLHIVCQALPDQAGYTLRTHQLMRAQRQQGMHPVCYVLPDGRLPNCDAIQAGGLGTRELDQIVYGRLTEPSRLRRALIRATDRLRSCNTPGSWRWGANLQIAEDPWPIVSDWALEQGQATVVHAHTPFHCAEGGRRVARALGIPLVYEVRGFWDLTAESAGLATVNAIASDEWRRRELDAARQADAVLTLSETMREELIRRGVEAERVRVVENGVDVANFRPAAGKDAPLCAQLALDGSFVLGYITNVRRLEGIETVLEALRHLLGRGARVTFVLVGDGADLERLRALAERLGVDAATRFTGRVPHRDIQRYYSLFDAFVVPRTDDAVCRLVTPLKPLEAMALEIPTVVSDIPALRELVTAGETGLAFRVGDALDLARTTEGLMNDAQRRASLGRAARRWVQSQRDWSKLAARTAEIYRHVAGGPSLQGCASLARVQGIHPG